MGGRPNRPGTTRRGVTKVAAPLLRLASDRPEGSPPGHRPRKGRRSAAARLRSVCDVTASSHRGGASPPATAARKDKGTLMAQVFHRSMNTISQVSLVVAAMVGGAVPVLAYVINKSPNETLVKVVRDQPIPFSHEHHARGLGIDCRYCHTSVEVSASAGMPPTYTCMSLPLADLEECPDAGARPGQPPRGDPDRNGPGSTRSPTSSTSTTGSTSRRASAAPNATAGST